MAIPLADWSIDVVTPQTVCVQKDGVCLQQILPEFGETASLVAVPKEKDEEDGGGDDRGDVVAGDVDDVRGQVPAPGYYVLVAQYKGQTGPQDQVRVNVTYNNEGEGNPVLTI